MKDLAREFEKYAKLMKKYGVFISKMEKLQNDINKGKVSLTCTHEHYSKDETGKWKSEPDKSRTETATAMNYCYTITSIPIFKDKITRKQTRYGNIPMIFECVSWGDGSEKSKRVFKITEM